MNHGHTAVILRRKLSAKVSLPGRHSACVPTTSLLSLPWGLYHLFPSQQPAPWMSRRQSLVISRWIQGEREAETCTRKPFHPHRTKAPCHYHWLCRERFRFNSQNNLLRVQCPPKPQVPALPWELKMDRTPRDNRSSPDPGPASAAPAYLEPSSLLRMHIPGPHPAPWAGLGSLLNNSDTCSRLRTTEVQQRGQCQQNREPACVLPLPHEHVST